MKRICIDARFFGITHTGIGRYTKNLIANLPHDPEYDITLIVGPEAVSEASQTGYKVVVAKYHPYSLMAQIEMPILLNKLNPDLVHFTHFFVPIFWTGNYVVTIHDLIKHEFSDFSATTRNPLVYLIKHWGYLLTIWLAIIRAKRIIVPTQYGKDELVRQYHLDPSKIIVTYEGVEYEIK